MKNAIHATAELNASNLRIFGGYHGDVKSTMCGIDYANGFELVIKGIEAVLPEAEKCGVTLALENHGRLPGLSEELLFIMRHFNSPQLGICFDVANFLAHNMNENEDPIRAYEKLKKYIKHVHFKDWKTAPYGSPKRVVPTVLGSGDGIVPIRQMAYLLEKDGFAGYCSLEYEASELEGVAESINYMHSLKKSAEFLYPEVKK